MSLANITYNEIIEAVKNYIKTNCTNIANYSSIPACFKSGYTASGQIAGNATANSTYSVSITKAVAQVNDSTVDTDMTNFINSLGLGNKLTTNCSANNFFNFMNNMISFCSTKLAFATSQYSTNKYLIYYTNNSSYKDVYNIEEEKIIRLIYASDIHQMLNAVFNIAKQNIRNVPCTYSITVA